MKVIQFLTCSHPQQVTQQKHITAVDKIVLDPSCRGELAHYTKNIPAQLKEHHESKRFKFVHYYYSTVWNSIQDKIWSNFFSVWSSFMVRVRKCFLKRSKVELKIFVWSNITYVWPCSYLSLIIIKFDHIIFDFEHISATILTIYLSLTIIYLTQVWPCTYIWACQFCRCWNAISLSVKQLLFAKCVLHDRCKQFSLPQSLSLNKSSIQLATALEMSSPGHGV